MEIRLMIWELTWPPPRVIEATYHEDLNAEEFKELTILRPCASLSTFLKHNIGIRILQDKAMEDCPNPVALQVCNESRRHTLRKYTALRHAEFKAGSFYFSPSDDILWFSHDFTDEERNIEEVEDHYGDQLHRIKNVLVEEIEWSGITPADYTEGFLYGLGNLQNIFLVYEIYDDNGVLLPDARDLPSLFERYRYEYECFTDEADNDSGIAKHIKFLTRRIKSI
ncbi:hypothetical protein PISL3812_00273 [Talaromyces islandicus]|uniref:2EXR domain-containing protein n=1 Tax=Talaromyces islandicus TaxID=28573 RepID=A0A0U1LKK0_TALIS|nr:hypothetical protein PISL3812_00273 [Talaromyces islandicus]